MLAGFPRSNNYIETLKIEFSWGIESGKTYSPIIPNSQLILLGYQSASSIWGIEMFVNPSTKVFYIILGTIGLLGVCIFFILVIYLREKVEDKQNRFWGGILE